MSNPSPLQRVISQSVAIFGRLPDNLIALLGRFALAAVFWRSGQTKIEGFMIDIFKGEFKLGWPHLSDSALALFRDEYKVPLLSPELAAPLAAFSEHMFPLLLLLGLGSRFAALGLLGMTLTIQLFVYPNSYPDHSTWAAICLYLIAKGPGKYSIDAWIANRFQAK